MLSGPAGPRRASSWRRCARSAGCCASPCPSPSLWPTSTGVRVTSVLVTWEWGGVSRFYEKSIIRVEIEEQRSVLTSQWDETKKSIRDARHKINLQLSQGQGFWRSRVWLCLDIIFTWFIGIFWEQFYTLRLKVSVKKGFKKRKKSSLYAGRPWSIFQTKR